MDAEKPGLDLPPFSLDVQAMELGADTNAVGLELIETESREPLRGGQAGAIWAAALGALPGMDPWVVDFFSHLDRVREFCKSHHIEYRDTASRCLVVPQPAQEAFRQLLSRFEAETFGLRAGAAAQSGDEELENELSHRGLDAYQAAYPRYTFCAVCDLSDAWVTLLSEKLWPSEIIRRVRPALQPFDVYIARPQ
jgi:hypothetical protein